MSDSSRSETRRMLHFRIHVLPKITHQFAIQKEGVKDLRSGGNQTRSSHSEQNKKPSITLEYHSQA